MIDERVGASRAAARVAIGVGALAALILVGACGDEASSPSDLTIRVSADWSWAPTAPDQLGYSLRVVLGQRLPSNSHTCRDLPASLEVTANGQEVPFVRDAANCLDGTLTIRPLAAAASATVEVTEGGRNVGEAMFGNLTPGAGAMLAFPADGVVHPGDELVIVPTFGLPSSEVLILGYLYPLDQEPWTGRFGIAQLVVREPDGLHVQLPAFSGRAVVMLGGSPLIPIPMLSCEGFAICKATATNALGPVYVTENP